MVDVGSADDDHWSIRMSINGVQASVQPFVLRDGGFLRLKQILHPHGPLPISRSAWWEGVRNGVYPQPVRLGKRITAWRSDDIRILAERGIVS